MSTTIKRLLKFLLRAFAVVVVCLTAASLVAVTAQSADAATFYVDSTITDANAASGAPDCTNYNPSTFACSGGSGSAYRTIADINAASFSRDDQILFRKGQTWREQLTIPSSGSSGHPITFGAYGSGSSPIISGANVITPGTNWEPTAATTIVDSQTANFAPLGLGNQTAQTWQAQQWTATETFALNNVTLKLRQAGTIPSGNVWVDVYNDSSEAPGAIITNGTSNTIVASSITTDASYGDYSFTFADPPILTGSATYYFVLKSTIPISSSNKIHIGARSGAGVGNFHVRWRYSPWQQNTDAYNVSSKIEKDNPTSVIWQATGITTEPKIVLLDGTVGNKKTSTGELASTRDWYWGGNTLYIYSADDPDTAYTSPGVEIGQRDYALQVYDKNHLTFRDISFAAGNRFSVQVLALSGDRPSETASYLTFTEVAFLSGYQHGIVVQGDGQKSYGVIEGSTAAYNGAVGIQLSSHTDHWRIRNNNIHNNGYTDESGGVENTWGAGIKVVSGGSASCDSHVAENNKVYYNGYKDSGVTRVHDSANKGFGIWFDIVDSQNIPANGSFIRYNNVHDNADSGLFNEKSRYHSWYYNLSYRNGEYGLRVDAGESGPIVQDNYFYNNTFYGNSSGIYLAGGSNQAGYCVRNNILKNNMSAGNTNYQLYTSWGGNNDGTLGSGNVYENNALGPEHKNFIQWGAGLYKSTYADWETSYGGATNSVKADPLFANAEAGDFTLQSLSPAINSGSDVGLTRDYAGGTVPYGSAPDIGAYEYETERMEVPENVWLYLPVFMALPIIISIFVAKNRRK